MIDILTKAALDAGQVIMAVHRAGPHVSYKDDCSPVTEADQRAETIILQALAAHFPEIPVIAEEAVSNGILPETGKEFFWSIRLMEPRNSFPARTTSPSTSP